jgi:hypothetical protein
MDGQRAKLAARRFDRATTIPPATEPTPDVSPPQPAPAPVRRPAQASPSSQPQAQALGQLSGRWAAVLGFGWPLAIVASMALEPTPADPSAPVPVLAELANLGLFIALVGTAIAAGVRHGAAAVGGVVTGLLVVPLAIACPVSGHHAIGLWWFAELGILTAMLAVSGVALQRTRR